MTPACVDVIIQARLGSSRLPQKVLADIAGKKLIEHVCGRARAATKVGRIIVATTTEPEDDALAHYCERMEVACFRGSKEDVLSRLIGAAQKFQCDHFLRVCGDNPLIEIKALDRLAAELTADPALDYCSYCTQSGIPIILKPIGVFAEGVRLRALEQVSAAATGKYREHVTMFIYENPTRFRVRLLPLAEQIDPELRFTVDYPEDLQHCQRIFELGGGHGLDALMGVMARNPELESAIRAFSEKHQKRY